MFDFLSRLPKGREHAGQLLIKPRAKRFLRDVNCGLATFFGGLFLDLRGLLLRVSHDSRGLRADTSQVGLSHIIELKRLEHAVHGLTASGGFDDSGHVVSPRGRGG